MSEIHALTKDKTGNYIFPFFWQHHENEDVLRTYMRVMYALNHVHTQSFVKKVGGMIQILSSMKLSNVI